MSRRAVPIAVQMRGAVPVIGPFTIVQAVPLGVSLGVAAVIFYYGRVPAVERGALALALPILVLLCLCARPGGRTLPGWVLLRLQAAREPRQATWAPDRPQAVPVAGPDPTVARVLGRLGGEVGPPEAARPAAPAPAAGTWPARARTQRSTLVPAAIDDRMLSMATGHRCGLVEVVGPNLDRLSDEERDRWDAQCHALLRGLDHPIKLITRVRPAAIEPYLADYEAAAGRIRNQALRALALHDIAYMRRVAGAPAGTGATSVRHVVAVPVPPSVPDTEARRGALATLLGLGPRERRPTPEETLRALDQRCAALIDALAPLEVHGWRLAEDEIAAVVDGSLNPRSSTLRPLRPGMLARAGMPLTTISPAPRPPVQLLF